MNIVRLSEIASINPRSDRLAADRPISFVGMAQLDGVSAKALPQSTRPFGDVAKGYTVFRDRDLLVAKITPCFENGKIGQAYLDHEVGVGSTEFHIIRPAKSVHERYLLHFLRSPEVRRVGALRMTGSGGQRRVPSAFLSTLRVPLPQIDEQRRIAAILDQAELVRARRRGVLSQVAELKSAAFVDHFGDAGSIQERWPAEQLGSRLTFLTSGSRGWARYYAATGTVFLRIQNVRRDELSLDDVVFVEAPSTAEAKRTSVQAGDVLLSITADLGRTAVVPSGLGAAHINQHLCILRAPTVVSRYLSAYLSSEGGQRQIESKSRAAVKAGLNFDDVRSLRIPMPPIELQHEFADCLAGIEAQSARLQRAVDLHDELFASLQSRAFKAEL